ncbi:GNAT family N-acetyltransferase [Vibrio japonicus]|uniref:tRNA(Met) cytidine acetyltransferase TmcA n=1 Tax=Vibrio japonicus TaxID=1824638 RepID=A0ABY5LIR0_9VIBR|nr:GNAT family N-acetyltransferase [Vibrio japonicus]UUM31919.1 GNAT family N-acetyltransferase [Vibrio japonicus]
MVVTQKYIHQLFSAASADHHRYGVVLRGDREWQLEWLKQLANEKIGSHIFQLGGEVLSFTTKGVAISKGQQLLGQECQLLICDLSEGFDANSFSAAIGCVVGGGLVVILPNCSPSCSFDEQWLDRALEKLVVVRQHEALPKVPNCRPSSLEPYAQQNRAVEGVRKVIEGRRKRPLVITADRGRGKSSALGIAAAQLMQSRTMHIIVTAPSIATIQPVFEHALRLLPQAIGEKNKIRFEGSILEFVAPDELLRSTPYCDCIFVDEASAIPIPMLKKMVDHYHRAVFSTTVHGYEGCGRGFTLKFQAWLAKHRPGYNHIHLDQPIRWNVSDPLEDWHFDSFLLDAELDELGSTDTSDISLNHISKQQLFEQPQKLRSCFALLVNAHYQTSPNDLMLLLADETIQLYAAFAGDICVGCILTVQEGGLDSDTIAQIQLGKRRPKGHLVATTLANQLGVADAARLSSIRIMRIAVHPQRQNQGVGERLLSQLKEISSADFYSTSFGATSELVSFWKKCGFTPVKLGSTREQSSGTHSLIMVSAQDTWLNHVKCYFRQFMHFSLSSLFQDLEIDLVRALVDGDNSEVAHTHFIPLVENYTLGGASFDSVAPMLDSYWKSCPVLINSASDLVIRKLIQQYSWEQCAREFSLAGRKQVEQQLRSDLSVLLSPIIAYSNLHCKTQTSTPR